ncbi:MAG: hypothetical protein R3F20_18450 [Planctomycetota bacterium]
MSAFLARSGRPEAATRTLCYDRTMPVRSLIALLLGLAAIGCDDAPAPGPEPAAPVAVGSLVAAPWPVAERGGVRFLTGGHLYGRPGIGPARPASTFVEAEERIRAHPAECLVLLGDCFYQAREPEMTATLARLESLGRPVFNAVGNHDLAPDPEVYRRRFGPTWSSFDRGPARFLILDSEDGAGAMSEAQLAFAEAAIDGALADERIRTLLVFMHKTLFADALRTVSLSLASNDPNAHLGIAARHPEGLPFRRRVRPLLERAARGLEVALFAGDVGAFPSRWGFWADREPSTGIATYACGLGDTPRDGLLDVTVAADGRVTVAIFPLGAAPPASREARGAAAWTEEFFPGGFDETVRDYLDPDR